MTLIFILLAMVLSLVLLTTVLKINPFLSFLIVSLVGGLFLGIPLPGIVKSMEKGLGDMFGSVLIIISLGAMLGKLVAESGAAQVIADSMIRIFGEKNIQWGLMFTGFIIGIPLFYNVGFVICIPIIFTLIHQYKLPSVFIGLPMMASLSVAHGFLPPHPSPVALVAYFHADLGKTLILGLILAIPALILAGPIFSLSLKEIKPLPGSPIFYSQNPINQEKPGVFISFLSALLPVCLLILTRVLLWVHPGKGVANILGLFLSEPDILMLLSLILASLFLEKTSKEGLIRLTRIFESSIRDIAMILLIIGGAGSLKQVLVDSGAGNEIASFFTQLPLDPLILGWLVAATIRICLGSATLAGLTTAGIILPIMNGVHINPSLMVLSIGSGSLMFSHVNDPGFWMFKEYFNISMKDTFRSWSLMETLVSCTGLVGVLVLEKWV